MLNEFKQKYKRNLENIVTNSLKPKMKIFQFITD